MVPASVRVEGAVLEVLSHFEELARARGVEFRVEADLRIEAAVEDRELHAILKELVGNAVRATTRGGWVRVNAQPEHDGVLISVKDSGRGFTSPKLREALSASSGGLSRVAGVVRSRGGRWWANSKAGKGATFYIALPRIPS